MTRVTLTIDRLVLTGVDPADRHALVDGLRGELARVLADPEGRGAWAKSHRTPVLRLGKMAFEPGAAGGRKLGAGVARAVGRGLKP
jgi:hypothetical protein